MFLRFPLCDTVSQNQNFLTAHLTQPIPVPTMPRPTRPIALTISSQHWILPTKNLLASSGITQPPTFIPTTFLYRLFHHLLIHVPVLYQLVFYFPFSYKHLASLIIDIVPKKPWMVFELGTLHQLAHELTHSEQYRFRNIRRLVVVASSQWLCFNLV